MPRKLKRNMPRQIDLIPYEEKPLKADEIRAQAVLSGISHGTEMNLYRGTSPFNDRHFDTDLRLFLPDDAAEGVDCGAELDTDTQELRLQLHRAALQRELLDVRRCRRQELGVELAGGGDGALR